MVELFGLTFPTWLTVRSVSLILHFQESSYSTGSMSRYPFSSHDSYHMIEINNVISSSPHSFTCQPCMFFLSSTTQFPPKISHINHNNLNSPKCPNPKNPSANSQPRNCTEKAATHPNSATPSPSKPKQRTRNPRSTTGALVIKVRPRQ